MTQNKDLTEQMRKNKYFDYYMYNASVLYNLQNESRYILTFPKNIAPNP